MWPFTKLLGRDARPAPFSSHGSKPTLEPAETDAESIPLRRPSTPNRRKPPRLQDHPARAHAQQLLLWLQDPEFEHQGQLITADIHEIYAEVCLHLGWRQRPWNPVAREFARLTTDGRKIYATFLIDGRIRKLRVYPVCEPSATVLTLRTVA
jgi:hypothetical protein